MGECKYEHCIVTQLHRRLSSHEFMPPKTRPTQSNMTTKRHSAEMQEREICIYTTHQSCDFKTDPDNIIPSYEIRHTEYPLLCFSSLKYMNSVFYFPLTGLFLGNCTHMILQSYNQCSSGSNFCDTACLYVSCATRFQQKSVTPWFVQCHGNQTPMCMKMRLLWCVCLEFVGPMDPFLIRACVHVWASLFA